MGLFDFLKGKEKPEAVPFPAVLGATAKGTCIPMEEVPDPVFSTGVLGQCCGINPDEGKVYSPADGEISQVADTLHAIGITAAEVEILIHVGVDTVEMKGDGFASSVKEGQKVKKGELLLTMDLDKISAAGHPATVITVVTNTDDLSAVKLVANGPVQPGDDLFHLEK